MDDDMNKMEAILQQLATRYRADVEALAAKMNAVEIRLRQKWKKEED